MKYNTTVKVQDDAQLILNYLYPTTKKRMVLTRCLLYFLFKHAYVCCNEEEQTILAILQKLDVLLEDMENYNTQPEEMRLLKKWRAELAECDDLNVDRALIACDMFYNYSNSHTQQYTVACTMYELMAFTKLSLKEILDAHKKAKPANELSRLQTNIINFEGTLEEMVLTDARRISMLMFGPDAFVKRAVLELAFIDLYVDRGLLKGEEVQYGTDLSMSWDEIRQSLITAQRNGAFKNADWYLKNQYCRWLHDIAHENEVFGDTIVSVMERVLFNENAVECGVFTNNMIF